MSSEDGGHGRTVRLVQRVIARALAPLTAQWRAELAQAALDQEAAGCAAVTQEVRGAFAVLHEQMLALHHDAWNAAQLRHDHLANLVEEVRRELGERASASASQNADVEAASQRRHEHLIALLSGFHRDTWESARRLNEHVLQRLANVEQRVVSLAHGVALGTEGQTASAGPVSAASMRAQAKAHLRDAGRGPATPDGTVEVPTDVGRLLLPETDTVILPFMREHGAWEAEVGQAIRDLVEPGTIALDVGAHVGYFSVMLSQLVGEQGRVMAVEADPDNHRLLVENLKRSRCHNVMALWLAALDREGEVDFSRSPDRNSGDNRTLRWAPSGDVFRVPCLPLDEVVPSAARVGLVKVDVQGGDHLVVRGLSRTIGRAHPVLIVEFWPHAIREMSGDPREVLALYRGLGYGLRALEDATITEALPDEEIVARAESAATGFLNLVLRPVAAG